MRPHGYNDFTFQSGFILMRSPDFSYIHAFSFTFQSGFILIMEKVINGQLIDIFTFQSGFILIVWITGSIDNYSNLYIPIWFYSNARQYESNANR